MRLLSSIAVGITLATTTRAQVPVLPQITSRLVAREAEWVEFRRDLHRHPEVSGAEERTAAQVAQRLRAAGIAVRTGVGGHGVIGIVRGAKPGPVIAYRADMDAVFSNAPDPVDFASTRPGVRHICGHDLHTTIGVALAESFAAIRDRLTGTVLFVFQPAEERATGANAMLRAGVFDNPAPMAIYGLHTAPFPVGQLATEIGDLMSGRDRYRIVLAGTGDLAAAADTVRRRLEGVGTVPPSKMLETGPRDLILVSPGPITDSTDSKVLQGTIMATGLSRPRVLAAMDALRRIRLPHVSVTVDYQPKTVAGVTNDSALTVRATAAVDAALGTGAAVSVGGIIPAFSEDFGAFQDRVPGVFFFLGVSNPAKGTVGMPHSPDYVADEGAILVGAKAMAAVLLDHLGRG